MKSLFGSIALFSVLVLPSVVTAQSHSATLTWVASAPANVPKSHPVAGYTPMRGEASGGPYAPLIKTLDTKTTYVDATVQAGHTYYYVVTATDTAGNVSPFSNEVVARIPAGPLTISTSSLPGAMAGVTYSAALSISGGAPPYHCTWTGLASGLAGIACGLTGAPTDAGSYNAGVVVTDSSVPPRSVTGTFTGTIVPLPPSKGFWAANAVPANATGNDSKSVEVGLRFLSSVAGAITAIRFFRATNTTGTNSVHLWGPSGHSLAQATAPPGSGWITVALATPVTVKPGETYTASYHTLQYAWNADFFAKPLEKGALTAPANAGVYRYGSRSEFPSSIYRASNYWVDVVFEPAH